MHAEPRSSRDKVIAHSAMSVGYGREVGVIMLIYIMAFAYAACSPIILPFTLCYFTSVWVRAHITHGKYRKDVMHVLCNKSGDMHRCTPYGACNGAAPFVTLQDIDSYPAAPNAPLLVGNPA